MVRKEALICRRQHIKGAKRALSTLMHLLTRDFKIVIWTAIFILIFLFLALLSLPWLSFLFLVCCWGSVFSWASAAFITTALFIFVFLIIVFTFINFIIFAISFPTCITIIRSIAILIVLSVLSMLLRSVRWSMYNYFLAAVVVFLVTKVNLLLLSRRSRTCKLLKFAIDLLATDSLDFLNLLGRLVARLLHLSCRIRICCCTRAKITACLGVMNSQIRGSCSSRLG